MSDFAAEILAFNRDTLCRSAREVIDDGMENPVLIIADLRDEVGRMFAETNGEGDVIKLIQEYAAKGTVPTMIVGVPLDRYREIYQAIHDKPFNLPPADPGHFYASVITGGRTKTALLPLPASVKPSAN